MARKTFISYKYSEAINLRDKIIDALGDDATYYQGETTESPDLTDTSVEYIKKNLKDMMFNTSVTIVIASPNIIQSKWIDWEIEYSLKEITREDQTSRTNGIVCVIMKHNGTYDWLIRNHTNDDGCSIRTFADSKLYNIINKNRYNYTGDDKYSCSHCKTFNQLDGSYISLIDEDRFLLDPSKYIENAYDKSKNISNFKISKLR
ncbi:TIR domain-containing protein [Burkholderia cepacia]|uniref:TIR domain-containing protein n=1 Tax=Burkholderia cepacia TaxID=292 RepID=UPI002AB0ED37|nr:TIR domain-containing protein [Burkholderia cepacia]